MHRLALRIRWVVVCSALALNVSAQQAVSTTPGVPDPESRFLELRQRGGSAFEAGHFDQARGLLLQAWSMQPRPEVAFELGQSELELKRYGEAAQHLDVAIRNLDAATHAKELEQARKSLDAAKTKIGVLQVSTNRMGAEIRVDGVLVGKAPLPGPLYLEPGIHEIAAKSADAGITRPVSLQAGQASSLSLPIVAKPTNVTHATETRREPLVGPRESASPSLVPVIAGGAVFLAGITTGIVFRLDSDSQFRDANALRSKLASQGCMGAPSTYADCAALELAAKNGDRSRNWSTAGFLTAAGALLATGTYWYWPRANRKDSAWFANRVRLGAVILPEASGFSISGDY